MANTINKLNYHDINKMLSPSPFLNWEDRPKPIVDKIDSVFNRLKEDVRSQWGVYNGRDEYRLLTLKDQHLVKKIIKDSPTQKEFIFLDIGAGDFQWGRQLCRFLNKQVDLPSDISVHIISIRGEGGKGRLKELGKCKVYELTAFKVENLFSEFKSRGLDFERKVDLATSSWCFRHLVDPLGTFIQTYDLLRPHQGMLLMDGFFYHDAHLKYQDPPCPDEANAQLVNILVHLRAPFLLIPYNKLGSLWQFLIKKSDANPCQLPMSYYGLTNCSQKAQVGSRCITQFEMHDKKYDLSYLSTTKITPGMIFGDPRLYQEFKDPQLLDIKLDFKPCGNVS